MRELHSLLVSFPSGKQFESHSGSWFFSSKENGCLLRLQSRCGLRFITECSCNFHTPTCIHPVFHAFQVLQPKAQPPSPESPLLLAPVEEQLVYDYSMCSIIWTLPLLVCYLGPKAFGPYGIVLYYVPYVIVTLLFPIQAQVKGFFKAVTFCETGSRRCELEEQVYVF